MDTYTCVMCKEVFEKGWTDEEADAETQKIFGVTRFTAPCDVVCDDCWQNIKPVEPLV